MATTTHRPYPQLMSVKYVGDAHFIGLGRPQDVRATYGLQCVLPRCRHYVHLTNAGNDTINTAIRTHYAEFHSAQLADYDRPAMSPTRRVIK